MIGRDYYLLPDQEGHVKEPQAIRYAVGQPMGAYSSWGMLAVTHHYIVQYCAARVGLRPDNQTWFEGYEVLGDDIVIFNKLVAEEYLKACEGLGVSINMSKSVVSDNGQVVEFAKRTSLRGIDVSAISWRMLAANDHLLGRVQISMHMLLKGVGRSALAVIQDASRRNP